MESRPTVLPAGSISTSSRLSRRPAGSASREAEARVRPKKSLGQHFLSDRNIIRRIADAAELRPGDAVLDIGAGPGELTAALAERGAEVWAVEVDRGLAHSLRERFAAMSGVHVLEQDALAIEVGAIFGGGRPFSVVANLPYNVGTAIVRRLLESEPRPSRLVVMLQKEVALAMVASPGHMSLVSVGVQVFATGRRLFDVAPGAFFPPPRVTSTVIRLDARPGPLVPAEVRAHFFKVVRAGFSAPRKQLRNSLANGLGVDAQETTAALNKAGIDPKMRPQELSVQQWLELSRWLRG